MSINTSHQSEHTTNDHQPLRIAAIGLGGRGRTYLGLAARMPEKYLVTAAADIQPSLVKDMKETCGNPDFQSFHSDKEILSVPKLADVMVIGTQDAQHREHAIAAMEMGYDLLLEKPIANNLEDVLAVEEAAIRLGRKVLVCHVLRYSPLYLKVKEIVDSGRIGEIISINALEGVGFFHHAHAYVRGHWRKKSESSPMIISKSCHDLDIIQWLAGSHCSQVSSFGALDHFTSANKPEGAPERCHLGCPVKDECPYDSDYYISTWKKFIYVNAELEKPGTTDEQILEWIRPSPWGRCVYQCDNDVVDHQTLNMTFANGVTATFTMTAFARGRNLEIFGTRGGIRAGALCKATTGSDILVLDVDQNDGERISVEESKLGYDGHGGGDTGIMEALYSQMALASPAEMSTSIQTSVMSHVIGFAAEQSRLTGKTIPLADFLKTIRANSSGQPVGSN